MNPTEVLVRMRELAPVALKDDYEKHLNSSASKIVIAVLRHDHDSERWRDGIDASVPFMWMKGRMVSTCD